MVNIFSYAKKVKAKAMDYREKKQQARDKKASMELERLKKRNKVEGERAKLYASRDKEASKLKEYKKNLRKRTPAYRVANAVIDNYKRYKKKKKPGMFSGGNFSL